MKTIKILLILLLAWASSIYALAPNTEFGNLSSISPSLIKASQALAQEIQKQFQQSLFNPNYRIDLHTIQNQWNVSTSEETHQQAQLLFEHFRLRDFHFEIGSVFLYFELENGEKFAYQIDEDGTIHTLTQSEYLQSLRTGNGEIKATPWMLMEDLLATYQRNNRQVLYTTHQGDQPQVFLNFTATSPKIVRIEQARDEYTRVSVESHRGVSLSSELTTAIQENYREKAAEFFGANLDEYDVYFVKNTSHGINTFVNNLPLDPNKTVGITIAEHHSNFLTWRKKTNNNIQFIPIHPDSYLVDLEKLDAFLSEHPNMEWLAIAGANNVPGGINDLAAIKVIAKRHQVKVFMDAAQYAPHRQVKMKEWDIDAMIMSGHKMGSYEGVLIVKKGILPTDIEIPPHAEGGGVVELVDIVPELGRNQVLYTRGPGRLEPGSPDPAAEVAFGAGLDLYETIGWYHLIQHEKELTEFAFKQLQELESSISTLQARVIGSRPSTWGDLENRLGVLTFDLIMNGEEIHDQLLSAYLSEYWGINIRNGCFCAHPVLIHAKGVNESEIALMEQFIREDKSNRFRGSMRMSLGFINTKADIEYFFKGIRAFLEADKISNPDGSVTINGIQFLQEESGRYYTPKIRAALERTIAQREQKIKQHVAPTTIPIGNLAHLFFEAAA